MSRFLPYLGVVAALMFAVLIMALADGSTLLQAPVRNIPTASSTISVLPNFRLPPITLPSLEPRENAPATSSTQKALAPTPKNSIPPAPKKTPVLTPTSTPVSAATPVQTPFQPLPSSSGNASLDTSASVLRAALVNIICYVPAGSTLHSISGSGVIIDPKGIILTNAHIAQYYLLADRGVSCTIRSGSPAIDSYKAALIFISPAWLRANPSILTQTAPSGTGENDFALLALTKSATSVQLPSSFPFIPLAQTPSNSGTPVVIASYGAQFLETGQIQSSLFPTIVFGSVKEVFTFATNTIDVLALGGSVAAQEGSSGGGVADASGALVGTITTSTTQGATDTRSLNAITTSYIRSGYASEIGQALDLLLAKPTSTAIADFAPQIPALASILVVQLP